LDAKQLGIRQETLVAIDEIRLAEGERHAELALRGAGRQAQIFAAAEEIAMLPERRSAEAEIGVVGDTRADGAWRAFGKLDGHRHLTAIIGRIGMADADGAEEIGLHQILPRRLGLSAVIGVALVPRDAAVDEIVVDTLQAVDGERAE